MSTISHPYGGRGDRRDDARRSAARHRRGLRSRGCQGQDPRPRGARGRVPLRDVRQPEQDVGGRARPRGDPHQGRLRQHALLLTPVERRHRARRPRGRRPSARDRLRLRHDGGRPHRLLGEAQQVHRHASKRSTWTCCSTSPSSRCSTASCRTSVCTTSPTAPSPTRPICCPAARSAEARKAQEEALEVCREDVVWLSGTDDRRSPPMASTTTRSPRPVTPTSSRPSAPASTSPRPPACPSRSAWRPRWCSASTASSSTTACGSPASGRTSS